MPKTIINSRFPSELEQTHLHIGWTKDGSEHVEVSVQNETIAAECAAQGRPHDSRSGWFVQLDRAGINRAIRSLRQARDDAFGRDE